jgi:tetratricopeptide (TPR) repeat protein
LNVKELKCALRQRGLRLTGKKAELQKRLFVWSAKMEGERVKSRFLGLRDLLKSGTNVEKNAEYNVEALTSRRKAINESRGILGLVDQSYFEEEAQSTSRKSVQRSRSYNKPTRTDLREMYMQAKFADQNGDVSRSKSILYKLLSATPDDGRVIRRLARLEMQIHNYSKARQLLQSGLRKSLNDAHLLHGMGQLERRCGNDSLARTYFTSAIEKEPKFPNPYHALGTLEHSCGNIQSALNIIQKGIRHCPDNHRLHHALGDIYVDAHKLDLAQESYKTALKHIDDREWGKAFIYNSLSYVAYAQGDMEECRTLLRRALDGNEMHAQGVIALAQLEESLGNIHDARRVYRDGIGRYEEKRRRRNGGAMRTSLKAEADPFDTSSLLENGSNYSSSYAGDKWINVFRSWARMEEIHGNYETAHIIFSKAVRLFPESIVLLTEWARLQVENGEVQKGKLLFEAACQRAGGRYVCYCWLDLEKCISH